MSSLSLGWGDRGVIMKTTTLTTTSTLIFDGEIVTDFFEEDGDSLLYLSTVTAWMN